MIDETVKIHNKTQFEMKLNYKFEKKRKDATYEVETYLFIPNSLGINRHTFRKVNFYDSIQNYIRFKTPIFTLEQIVNGAKSPFNKLTNAYSELAEKTYKQTIDNYEYHTKMFACILASAVQENTKFIISRIPFSESDTLCRKQIELLNNILDEYRKLRKKIILPTIKEDVFSAHLFADEYISLAIEKETFKLLEYVKQREPLESDIISKNLLELIKSETVYRIKHNYSSSSEEKSDNEEFMFRGSVLKKYIESVLYLDADSEKEGVWLEQILFAIAAGLSMLFATAIAFFYQSIYGNLTTQLFIVLVVSYIFKDRIKELTRIILAKSVLKGLFDFKTKLFIDEKHKIGVIKRSFDFIKTKNISKEIFSIRKKYKTKEFDNKFSKEEVILFRKKINLIPKVYRKLFRDYNSEAIVDILRFDVSRLLKKMDNPRKTIYTITDNGYAKTFGRRVYHINLVIKFIHQKETILNRFRLVLTRNGIKRIEPIAKEII